MTGANIIEGFHYLGLLHIIMGLLFYLAHWGQLKELKRDAQRHEAAVKEWKRRRYQARFEEYERQEADRGDPES